MTSLDRPDGFVNSLGTRIRSSVIFYDPDTDEIMSIGSIDWDTEEKLPNYWRLKITR